MSMIPSRIHSSPTKSILKSGASQSSVKSLFAKAPAKKVKKEPKPVVEEKLFDEEESDDDVIAVVVIFVTDV